MSGAEMRSGSAVNHTPGEPLLSEGVLFYGCPIFLIILWVPYIPIYSYISIYFSSKQVHDANIVTTIQAYGIPDLLTHNTKDFERFGEVIRIAGI